MARPVTIRDEDLLDAARAVFVEHGMKATTAQVAERAGVSEGTLFNRFRTKDELFQRAMAERFVPHDFLVELVERIGQGTARDNLVAAGQKLLEHFRRIMPLMMMHWSNPCDGPMSRFHQRGGPEENRKLVVRYLEGEMQRGRLRSIDPEIAAWLFVGPLFHAAFYEVGAKTRGRKVTVPKDLVASTVDGLLAGLAPPASRRPTSKAARPSVSAARRSTR